MTETLLRSNRVFSVLVLTLVMYISGLSQSDVDRHNSTLETSWLSCETKTSPLAGIDNAHWLLYDLGAEYKLGQVKLWNINHPDFLDSGTKQYRLDLSTNLQAWKSAGQYQLSRADGSGFYVGELGPNLENERARFVLFTVLSNYGATCSGLAEIKIDVEESTTPVIEYEALNFSIAPNPATNFINVNVTDSDLIADYSVTDASGKLVAKGRFSGTKLSIACHQWTTGWYTVTLQSGLKKSSENIIVQKY